MTKTVRTLSTYRQPTNVMIFIDARALFERVVGTFSPDKARPIWETWANYEYNFGDLAAADKLEKRISEVYPDGTSHMFLS
jgi:Suppressor of forked protein (Suf)